MRVGHIYKKLGRPSDGASNAVLSLCSALPKIPGIEIALFSYQNRWLNSSYQKIESLNIDQRSAAKVIIGGPIRRLTALLYNLDLVHIHGAYYSLENLAVARAANVMGVPYVYTPHMILNLSSIRPDKLKHKLFKMLFGLKFLNRARWVQAFTDRERDLLRKYGVKTPIKTIPNGVENFLSQAGTNSCCKIVKSYNSPRLGFLGRLDIWTKGIDLLVRAFAEVVSLGQGNRPTLFIAGPDWYDAKIALLRMAEDLGVAQHVVFLGEIPLGDVGAFLREMDMLILPSRTEGFPRVVFEACAVGCPVIVTPGSNVGDIVEKHQVGIGLKSETDLPKAIELMLRSPDKRRAMGARGKGLAAEMTWDRVALQMLDAYKESIGN